MTLAPGTRLGPYELVGFVGAGGMGEVYRARDPRLGRSVAVKVLPATHATTPDRVERFAREARAAAALNHPNVLAVHDVGTDGDRPYIVSEFLEGTTLRDAIEPGRPWPVRKAVDVAVHVAHGLAAAHARGIVHRDLKPENVFVCHDGAVKILDFGLARLSESFDGEGQTVEQLTRENTIVGTIGYMAPEQVRGQPLDHRADIFAFGAVAYELLTGHRAFSGDSAADVMTAILTRDPPDFAERQSAVPGPLARIVMRCLDKRPEARFQSASDLAFALKAASSPDGDTVSTSGPVVVAGRGHPGAVVLTAAAIALAAAAAVGWLAGRSARSNAVPPLLVGAQRLTDLVGLEETPALSPDGKSVAFTASAGGTRQVFVRLLAGGNPLQVTVAPGGCRSPRWSPDSSSIVCHAPATQSEPQGALWEVPALGGPLRRVADSLGEADLRREDGRLAYFQLGADRVELVSATSDGSAADVIRRFPAGRYYWHPRWSPDGRFVAYQQGDGVRFDIFVVPTAGGDPRQLTHDNALISGLAWLPDGAGIIYSSSRGSTMPYLPTFTLWRTSLDGAAPRRLTSEEASYLSPDVHQDGRLAVARLQMAVNIRRMPVDGTPAENVRNAVALTRQTGHVQTPTSAPDGSAVAFLSDSGGHANIWISTGSSEELRQVTYERDPTVSIGVPIWSPDGTSIAFVSSRGNEGFAFGIWAVAPDGSRLRRLVQRGFGAAWSADGRWLYFVERTGGALKKVSPEGGEPIVVRTDGARNAIGSSGTTLYFLDERPLVDGRPEFLIMAATPENGPSRVIARVAAARVGSWQIMNPALSPDGKWMAQALTDGLTTNLWALSTSTGQWRQVTDFGDRATFIARRVDWAPDGRSILAAIAEGDADIVLLEGLAAGASP